MPSSALGPNNRGPAANLRLKLMTLKRAGPADGRPSMNWLLNNPISEMPGPMFLALYAGLIALIFLEAFFKNRRADRSRELGPMPIPTKPDPCEIAYLRGGENE